jgi:hypothetical protein
MEDSVDKKWLTHFTSVQSRTHGALDASVYFLYNDELLRV